MQVSELDEETQDLDWFAIDGEGAIGHFATGGCGALPRSIASSLEDLQKVTMYFKERVEAFTMPVVSESINSFILFRDEEAKARYLEDFIKMASQGLFSFDFLRTGTRPAGYFRVAKPNVSLQARSLPQEICQILERTLLQGIVFRDSDKIDVKAVQ